MVRKVGVGCGWKRVGWRSVRWWDYGVGFVSVELWRRMCEIYVGIWEWVGRDAGKRCMKVGVGLM